MTEHLICTREEQDEGASPFGLSIALTTGKAIRFNDPAPKTRHLAQMLDPWLENTPEGNDLWVAHRPTPNPPKAPLEVPMPWTIGEAMALCLVPILVGKMPRRIRFRGMTHQPGKLGVSHIAEGLLPMMDRRGTRSYMEVDTWGEQGEALIDVRPPLASLGPANLAARGDVVEIVAWVAVGESFSQQEEWEEETHKILEDEGWFHPEVEIETLGKWDSPPRLFIRVEFGNIRWLGESSQLPGERPGDTIRRAVSQLRSAPALGGVLQANWAYPLYLASCVVPDAVSLLPTPKGSAGAWILSLLQRALPHLLIQEREAGIELVNPKAGELMPGGYEMDDFWYPSPRNRKGK